MRDHAKHAVQRVEKALDAMREGRMVILTDDEDRENEGDLCMAAEKVTPAAINFMAKHGRGLICLSLTEEKVRQLRLPLMVDEGANTSSFGTAFTVSIEAKEGVTTGISARDRAHTILTAVRDGARPEDLARPGHVFPLRARKGGVLVRAGQTEGSVDLARLAGLKPAGVICEVMNDDGTMSRMPELEKLSRAHDLPIVSVADLIAYRMMKDTLVRRAAEAPLPTEYGEFRAVAYENDVDAHQHVALVKGRWREDEAVLVRVHSKCLTGDVFGSQRCDCGPQLHAALRADRAGRQGRPALPRPGGARHRPRQQAQGLQPAGPGATTPPRPTCSSASSPTCATTASAPRSCATSACARCGSSPTTRRRSSASRGTGSRWWSASPSRCRPPGATAPTS